MDLSQKWCTPVEGEHFLYQNRYNSAANTYGKKDTIQICSGPEGLRSLDLTLRKRSHYPCYATSPKFRMFSP